MSPYAGILRDLVLVFVGGGTGAVCRWSISRIALGLVGSEFPWGTLTVNLLGCLMVGFVVGALDFGLLPVRARPLLVAGFLGGLTTFSTYAYGLFEFARRGQVARALFQFGLENVLGIGLVFVGFWVAESIRN
ncbi:MAG: fluoride efflux transporter CrcB [Spirochaetota bacterium]